MVRKILKVLGVLVLIGVLSSPVMAAWTITVSEPTAKTLRNNDVVYRIQIYLKSDGSDLAEFSLKTKMGDSIGVAVANSWMARFNGSELYELVTDPGTAPDSTYTLAFDSALGGSLLDLGALSATVTEHTKFAADLGFNPIFWDDLDIDIGDIGSANDEVTIYIYIK